MKSNDITKIVLENKLRRKNVLLYNMITLLEEFLPLEEIEKETGLDYEEYLEITKGGN